MSRKVAFTWISLEQMRADPVLGGWPLVRARMRPMMRSPVPEPMWRRMLELVAERDPHAARSLES
jgi:hypothetical protein